MRIADATSKGSDVSRRETSSNEGESMTEACVITKDKEYVAYAIKEDNHGNGIDMEEIRTSRQWAAETILPPHSF